jgi:hypothetical protein
LAGRLLFRNYGPEIPEPIRTESAAHLQRIRRGERMLDFAGTPRRTPRAALLDIQALRQSNDHDTDQQNTLADLERYIRQQFEADFDGDAA